MNITYLNEHLIYGKIGYILVAIAFLTALFSSSTYFLSMFFSSEKKIKSWNQTGRMAFSIHAVSTLGIIGLLFFLIYRHYFEYYYVWHHSSLSLPVYYMFACFWEGQEGSILLWAFWHVLLSFFIIKKSGTWEAPVMGTIAVVQFFLISMLLGITVFGNKIGSSPFILLREHPDMANMPFVKMPDYLSMITDGRGLNPLLQNYWMILHPPVLFLGFASIVIPFGFAIGSLIKRKYAEWIVPALPYTVFGMMILGVGILMGGAWAYEALSFGGFWAWDPVENASLMPWLVLVAALHGMLIFKHRQQSLMTTYILVFTSFWLVLYSTFLTRSGILGEASVHSFTDLGLSGQILTCILFFIVVSVILLVINRKKIPSLKQEDTLSSREFWMFIGMLVLVVSCFQITLSTSIPVINKLFGSNFAPPVDVKAHYHAWQIPLATIMAFLIAIGQFFKWKQTNINDVIKKLALSFFVSIVISVLIIWGLHMEHLTYFMLLFASVFSVIANADYIYRIFKGKFKLSGASLTHIGFGFILLGALISNSKSTVISQNNSGMDLGKEFSNNENIMLVQHDTLQMGDYYVSYKGREKKGVNLYYEIEYFKKDEAGLLKKTFSLKPLVQLNEKMGNVAEPSTKHFLTKDIYTHISYADLEDNDTGQYKTGTATVFTGDTLHLKNCFIIADSLNKNDGNTDTSVAGHNMTLGIKLRIIDRQNKVYSAEPVFIIKGEEILTKEAIIDSLGLKIVFSRIFPETGGIELSIGEKKEFVRDFVIMKAIIFPYINLLWLGSFIFIFGCLIVIRHRIKELF